MSEEPVDKEIKAAQEKKIEADHKLNLGDVQAKADEARAKTTKALDEQREKQIDELIKTLAGVNPRLPDALHPAFRSALREFHELPDVPQLRGDPAPELRKQHAALIAQHARLRLIQGDADTIRVFQGTPALLPGFVTQLLGTPDRPGLDSYEKTRSEYQKLLKSFEDATRFPDALPNEQVNKRLQEELGLHQAPAGRFSASLTPAQFQAMIDDLHRSTPPFPTAANCPRLREPLPQDPKMRAQEEMARRQIVTVWFQLYGNEQTFEQLVNPGGGVDEKQAKEIAEKVRKAMPAYNVQVLRHSIDIVRTAISTGGAIEYRDHENRVVTQQQWRSTCHENMRRFFAESQEYYRQTRDRSLPDPPTFSQQYLFMTGLLAARAPLDGVLPNVSSSTVFPDRPMNAVQLERLGQSMEAFEKRLARFGITNVPPATIESVVKSLSANAMMRDVLHDFTNYNVMDFALLALIIHHSEDKVRAMLHWQAVMGINASVTLTSRLLLWAATYAPGFSRIAMWLMQNPSIPAHAKIAIAIGIIVLGHDQIDSAVTSVDNFFFSTLAIPGREQAGYFISLLGLPFEAADWVGEQTGMTPVDPERDMMAYFADETIFTDEAQVFRRGLHRTFADWNASVDGAIKQNRNPIVRSLWGLERVDGQQGPAIWARRRSVNLLRRMNPTLDIERRLREQLDKRGGAFAANNALNLAELATRTTTPMSPTRNDRAVAQELRTGPIATIRNAVEALPRARPVNTSNEKTNKENREFNEKNAADIELRELWEAYVNSCRDIARDVAVYVHLGVYNRIDWLGDNWQDIGRQDRNYRPTEFVQDGMALDIAYYARRTSALRHDAYPALNREQYALALAHAIRVRDQLGIMATVMQPFTNLGGFEGIRKRLVNNINEIGGIDLDHADVHHQALMKAAIAASESGANPEQFNKAMEEVRKLVFGGDTVSLNDLRKAHAELTKLTLNQQLEKAGPPPAMNDGMRTRLGVPRYSNAFQIGTFLASDSRVPTVDILFHVFGYGGDQYWRQPRGAVPDVAPLGSPAQPPPSDRTEAEVIIFQGQYSPAGASTYRRWIFNCASTDRRQWSVREDVCQANIARQPHWMHIDQNHPYLRHDVTREPIRTLTFEQWAKSYPTLGFQMEGEFARQQGYRRSEETRAKEETDKRDKAFAEQQKRDQEWDKRFAELAKERASTERPVGEMSRQVQMETYVPHGANQPTEFRGCIDVTIGDYTGPATVVTHTRAMNRGYGNNVVAAVRAPGEPSPFVQAMRNTRVPDANDLVEFELRKPDGSVLHTIRANTMEQYRGLGERDKILFDSLIITPMSDPQQSLGRIIRLMDYKYGTFESRSVVTREWLMQRLLPIYSITPGYANKIAFLRLLLTECSRPGVLDMARAQAIADVFLGTSEATRKRVASLGIASGTNWRTQLQSRLPRTRLSAYPAGQYENGGGDIYNLEIQQPEAIPISEQRNETTVQWREFVQNRDMLMMPLPDLPPWSSHTPEVAGLSKGAAQILSSIGEHGRGEHIRLQEERARLTKSGAETLRFFQVFDFRPGHPPTAATMKEAAAYANSVKSYMRSLHAVHRAIDLRRPFVDAVVPELRNIDISLPTVPQNVTLSAALQKHYQAVGKEYGAVNKRMYDTPELCFAAMTQASIAGGGNVTEAGVKIFRMFSVEAQAYGKSKEAFEKSLADARQPTIEGRKTFAGARTTDYQLQLNGLQTALHSGRRHQPPVFLRMTTPNGSLEAQDGTFLADAVSRMEGTVGGWDNVRGVFVDVSVNGTARNVLITLAYPVSTVVQGTMGTFDDPRQGVQLQYVQMGASKDGAVTRFALPERSPTVPHAATPTVFTELFDRDLASAPDLARIQNGTMTIAEQYGRVVEFPGVPRIVNRPGVGRRLCTYIPPGSIIEIPVDANGAPTGPVEVFSVTEVAPRGNPSSMINWRAGGVTASIPMGDTQMRTLAGQHYLDRRSATPVANNFQQMIGQRGALEKQLKELRSSWPPRTSEAEDVATQIAAIDMMNSLATRPLEGSFNHCGGLLCMMYANAIPQPQQQRFQYLLSTALNESQRRNGNPQDLLQFLQKTLGGRPQGSPPMSQDEMNAVFNRIFSTMLPNHERAVIAARRDGFFSEVEQAMQAMALRGQPPNALFDAIHTACQNTQAATEDSTDALSKISRSFEIGAPLPGTDPTEVR